MTYDTWLMNSRDYEKFAGLLPEPKDPPDWMVELEQERREERRNHGKLDL